MNLYRFLATAVCVATLFFIGNAQAAKILFITNDASALPNYDSGYVAHLVGQGHTVNTFTAPGTTDVQQQAAALLNDVVIISETIGSTAVSTGGVFNFATTPRPVINFEVFSWDEQKLTGPGNFTNLGNTGRPEVAGLGLGNMQDNVYITDAAHPLAGGLPAGSVQIYSQPYSVNFGVVGAGAQVVATADAAGLYPTHFMYPQGAQLVDGSLTPAKWIGLYLGQAPAGNPGSPGDPQFQFLNANGIKLLDSALACTLQVPEPTSLLLTLAGIAAFQTLRRRRGLRCAA